MSRGLFSSLIKEDVYKNASKHWVIELIQSTMYWYKLIVNPPKEFDTKKHISQALNDLKAAVEENLEKRFIYFITSRKRVRFSQTKKPYYSFGGLGSKLNIFLEEGKEKRLKKIAVYIRENITLKPIKPKVTTTDRFIIFTRENGDELIFSIHDFLQNFDVELGHSSTIQYVGYTKNPHNRPIDGAHSGLNDILYRVSNEDNDIFIYYNLFKVTAHADSLDSTINFFVANSMTDEIQVDKEGLIIEKCLILYFDSSNQIKNRASEITELENSLITLANDNKITSINMIYELEVPSEYFKFGSSTVAASDRHVFSYTIKNGSLELERSSKLLDEFSRESMGLDSFDLESNGSAS